MHSLYNELEKNGLPEHANFVFKLLGSGRLSEKLFHQNNTHIGVMIWKEHSSYTKSDLRVNLSPNSRLSMGKEPTFF